MGLFDDLLGNSVFCCSHRNSNNAPKPKAAIASYTDGKDIHDDKSSEEGYAPLPRRVALSTVPAVSKQDGVCGIGIVFQDSSEQGLFVSSLVLDGPAYQSKVIQQGDLLLRIDSVDVRKAKAADLGTLSYPQPLLYIVKLGIFFF